MVVVVPVVVPAEPAADVVQRSDWPVRERAGSVVVFGVVAVVSGALHPPVELAGRAIL